MKTIALLGMPNTGKSIFFNRLTNGGATTGNWSSVTVDLLKATTKLGDQVADIY